MVKIVLAMYRAADHKNLQVIDNMITQLSTANNREKYGQLTIEQKLLIITSYFKKNGLRPLSDKIFIDIRVKDKLFALSYVEKYIGHSGYRERVTPRILRDCKKYELLWNAVSPSITEIFESSRHILLQMIRNTNILATSFDTDRLYLHICFLSIAVNSMNRSELLAELYLDRANIIDLADRYRSFTLMTVRNILISGVKSVLCDGVLYPDEYITTKEKFYGLNIVASSRAPFKLQSNSGSFGKRNFILQFRKWILRGRLLADVKASCNLLGNVSSLKDLSVFVKVLSYLPDLENLVGVESLTN